MPHLPESRFTSASLRYGVGTLSGFFLSGRPDEEGPFHRVPVEPSKPIRFVIPPLPGQMDECDTHVREAFRDPAKLMNLKMFVDFPSDPSARRAHDPQKPPS